MSISLDNFFTSVDQTCRILFQVGGLSGVLGGVLSIVRESFPVDRINALYAAEDASVFISMADTQPGAFLPTQVRRPGKAAPILCPEKLSVPLIINDLDSFKRTPFAKEYRTSNFPFLEHHSLVRLPLFNNGGFVFLLNFWSDIPDAFSPASTDYFQRLTASLAGELKNSLSATPPMGVPENLPQAVSSYEQIALCPGLSEVRGLIEQVGPTNSTVLVQGETGVGKENVANAICELSERHNGPFVKVNCGAIPESLLESELFGHERGAFTGAHAARRGYFEEANEGTLFLDEIGEMPLSAQVSLLRVLDNNNITRVGGQNSIAVNVRIVLATNNDLLAKVREGSFRRDLWYRLAIFCIYVPPLRARKGDIPGLVQYLMSKKARELNVPLPKRIPDEEMARLYRHDWPGNTRELDSLIERSLIHLRGQTKAGPFRFAFGPQLELESQVPHLMRDWPTLEEMERRYIHSVLTETRGKLSGKGGAADILGIHYTTLRAQMRRMGVTAASYKVFGSPQKPPLRGKRGPQDVIASPLKKVIP